MSTISTELPAPHRVARRGLRWLSPRSAGAVSVVVLGLVLVVCLGSLPYTLGHTSPAPSAGPASAQPGVTPRRYEAGQLDAALLPPFWAPHRAEERAQRERLTEATGQSVRPLLGTDRLGRDVFARLLVGGAISLTIGLAAAAIAVLIGTFFGAVAATIGGRTDAIMMRAVDVLYGLPTILLIVLLAVAVDGFVLRTGRDISPEVRQVIGLATLLVAIGGVSWLTMARVIRGQVLSLKQQPFMEACRALGIPPRRQFLFHLLPNLLGPIVVYATLAVPTAILAESFLSFLGIGVREPLPSWGNLAADGLNELNVTRSRWWLLFFPCLMIAVTLLALNFAGEALREHYDVRRSAARRAIEPR